MARRGRSSRQRGTTLLELMIATSMLLVASTGFLAAMRQTINATAVAHRRTEASMLRSGLTERLTIVRRNVVAAAAGRGWIVESCYDADARRLSANDALAVGFTCPTDGSTAYQRFVSVTSVPDAAGAEQRVWSLAVYVERTGGNCTPATRYNSTSCMAAEHLITD